MAFLIQLHTPSLLVIAIVATAAMALAMTVVRPRQPEGLGLWALALLTHALACVFVLARGHLPQIPGSVLPDTLLTLSLALVLCAVAEFRGRPLPRLAVAIPVLLTAALAASFADNYQLRRIATSTIWAAQLALVPWALWRPEPPPQPRGALLVGAALGVQCLLLLARGLWFLTHAPSPQGLVRDNAIDNLALIAAHAILVLASLGFVLLAKDRADAVNRHLASNDALTGIANRRLLLQTLTRDVARAVRQHEPYAVLMADIDHFKAVNDRLGHTGGDTVLRHVAQLLRQHVRTQDLVGRWGGEEFLILLPNTSATGAQLVAEKLRQLVERTPCSHQGQSVGLTVSIGRCTEALEPGDTPSDLIEAAGKALYAAKRGGRNRVESASLPRMHLLRGALAAPARPAP